MKRVHSARQLSLRAVWGGSLLLAAATVQAGKVSDGHGNEAYDSAAECDAAVTAGAARFYKPFTEMPPLKRDGEADVKVMKLGDLPGFDKGACDRGVGRRNNRDGVAGMLVGRWVPYSPEMSVNVYHDAQGKAVRATMKQCDNNFSSDFPRPVGTQRVAAAVAPGTASDCFAYVLTPAKFETKTEQVLKVPATKRYEPVPGTFKAVSEQVLVTPELKRQIPVPATYKEVSERVLVRPESFREEPIEATFKTVSEQVLVKPESKRVEVIPGTFKTVTEQVMVTPERKELKVIPAVYGEREESVLDRPATTRVETVPATYKAVTDNVLVRAETLRYEPIAIPLRTVTEQVLAREASARLVANRSTLKTVTEQVVVREASKRLIEVPAVYETTTERVQVTESYRQWKRGRAYIGRAVDVRPLRSFVVGRDGKVDGASVDLGGAVADNQRLDDDVMCLVEIPATFETITRQVLKTPASVREEVVPAEYGTVRRQVLDQAATTSSQDLPAQYQTVTHRVIDIEKMKADGYKFDDKGNIIATPAGERVLRASAVAAAAGGAAAAAAKAGGAGSGEEGYVREIRVPAEYRTVTVQVVDKPATVRTVEVPAAYKTVKTTVVTKPATTEEVVIPAVYETVTRRVVDQAPSTRDIPIPAVYKTVEKRVVDTPASARKIPVPAVYETVTRRVVDTPASFREEVIPAVYRTVTRQVVDQTATSREVEVPAQYETLSYRVKVAEGKTEQRAILCDTNATPAKITEIQQALKAAGFDPGPMDGQLRALTMQAVNAYQQSKGLPVDGYLNLETVKALGVSPQ